MLPHQGERVFASRDSQANNRWVIMNKDAPQGAIVHRGRILRNAKPLAKDRSRSPEGKFGHLRHVPQVIH